MATVEKEESGTTMKRFGQNRTEKNLGHDSTSHSELPPIAHMESQHLTSPRPASTPHKDANNLMELLLPSSANSSRPGTPQDFAFPTIQRSNCRQL
ncbi:hypothetical protein TNCV_3963521 [Trichonephila clavipes]|nr:hypothetical protein TNCV_3963521 [Trichonephila clavipes]